METLSTLWWQYQNAPETLAISSDHFLSMTRLSSLQHVKPCSKVFLQITAFQIPSNPVTHVQLLLQFKGE